MALWQFEFDIRPSCAEGITSRPWSKVAAPTAQITFLPLNDVQPGRFRLYGDLDSTSVVMWYDEEQLTDICCRLDLRKLLKRDLSSLIDYTKAIHGCFCIDGKVYSPTLENLLPLMKESEANRFCKDPASFFNSLRNDALQKEEKNDS